MGTAWDRFWFAPQPVAPVILVRVAYGVLLCAWTLSLLPDLDTFFTRDGIAPAGPPFGIETWSLFALVGSDWFVVAAWAALLASALCLLAGRWTRVAAIAAFVIITSFERRNSGVFNAGDGLVRILALYLALAPAGASPDARRAPWALRLMQIQLSIIYVASVVEKLHGNMWREGTALGYALRIDDLERFGVLRWVADVPVLTTAATYGTLLVEAAVAVGVWIPRARVPVLAAGVAFHLGIAVSMRVGFFSAAMLTLYLAFVPPDRAERLLEAGRARLLRLAGRKSHATSAA